MAPPDEPIFVNRHDANAMLCVGRFHYKVLIATVVRRPLKLNIPLLPFWVKGWLLRQCPIDEVVRLSAGEILPDFQSE